jgi:hypothetical protein
VGRLKVGARCEGNELNPLTISQTATAISWTAMGSTKSVYVLPGRWLNKADEQAAKIKMTPAIPQPDSHRGIRRD